MSAPRHALRGPVLSFTGAGPAPPHHYWPDGLVLMQGGMILDAGPAAPLLDGLPAEVSIAHYPQSLILPGLIDAHAHMPQTQVIASYGAQLMDWLNRYTFVEEAKYADAAHARRGAEFFLDELLRNGTTSAAVYCATHLESAEAFFAASAARNTRMTAGKVMMDRNAPPALLDQPGAAAAQTRALIAAWHGKGRQSVAITPRFAITSTPEQLAEAARLKQAFPDLTVQTHLSENLGEIALARQLFPEAASYADIYARAGLLGATTLLGHCIHLDDAEIALLAASGSAAVFCPTSNLFLGSGLFDLRRLQSAGVRLAIATDIGAGTSYSMLRTLGEAYKVMQLQGQSFTALEAFALATHGNAAALGFGDRIGRIAAGFEADIAVLNPRATPAMAHRMETVKGDLAETLFVLMTLGDDRAVEAVYVAGRKVI